MIEMLFELFIWNSNKKLRRITIILSPIGIAEKQLFSLFRNNKFPFSCIVAISIMKITAISLFSYHPNIPFVLDSSFIGVCTHFSKIKNKMRKIKQLLN
jgi:hypothetical protein